MHSYIAALTPQVSAAAVTAFVVCFIVLGAIFLIRTSTEAAGDKYAAKARVYKVRNFYFYLLVAGLVVGLIFTLRYLPYGQFQSKPDEIVTVVGMQWVWKMAPGTLEVKPGDFRASNEITLPVDTNITFEVTSADVNHNFAIYSDRGVLLAQTQAMPGYRNLLQYRFREKGDYPILCLEYCGAPHTIMTGKIHVK